MQNNSSPLLAGITATTLAFATLFATTQASGQVIEDFESFADGSFTTTGDWTINDGDADQGSRSAEVVDGLSFDNGTYNINGGNRALQLNLPEADGTDPANDFAVFDFSSTPVGADGETIEFRYLFQASNEPSFLNFGVSGDATADRPSRTSSAALALRGDEQARIWDSGGTSTSELTGDISDGETHLAIGRVTFDANGDETYQLWIDPTSTDLDSLTPNAIVTTDGNDPI